jgi:hypothetical protein
MCGVWLKINVSVDILIIFILAITAVHTEAG